MAEQVEAALASYVESAERREILHHVAAVSAFVVSIAVGTAFVVYFGEFFAPQVDKSTIILGVIITGTATGGIPATAQLIALIRVIKRRGNRPAPQLLGDLPIYMAHSQSVLTSGLLATLASRDEEIGR